MKNTMIGLVKKIMKKKLHVKVKCRGQFWGLLQAKLTGSVRSALVSAVIAAAKEEKSAGRGFCRLARDVPRVRELVSAATPESKLAR